MPLTALQHQKAAALQQISMLARPGGMADPAMMKNAVNRMAPLISQWERSDPEFAQLGMLLRRARVKPTPNTLAMVSAQAQRMVSLIRTGLPHRTNRAGEKQVWDPGRGHVTSPMFEKGEPLRTFSPMGWRGSKKYPFGKAFPEKNLIEGLSGLQRPGFLTGLGLFGKGGPAPSPSPPPPKELTPADVPGGPPGDKPPETLEEAFAFCDAQPTPGEQDICRSQVAAAAGLDAGPGRRRRSKKPLVVGIFILLLGGAGLMMFLKRKKSKKEGSPKRKCRV